MLAPQANEMLPTEDAVAATKETAATKNRAAEKVSMLFHFLK